MLTIDSLIDKSLKDLSQKKVVIIIDDNEDDARSMEMLFRISGVEAHCAVDPGSARGLIKHLEEQGKEVCMVRTDDNMGVRNESGRTFKEAVASGKVEGLSPNTPVELISGHAVEDNITQSIQKGEFTKGGVSATTPKLIFARLKMHLIKAHLHKLDKHAPDDLYNRILDKTLTADELKGFGQKMDVQRSKAVEYAEHMSQVPSSTNELGYVDNYVPDDAENVRRLRERTDWRYELEKLKSGNSANSVLTER